MTEKELDQYIKATMSQAEIPDLVRERIQSTTNTVRTKSAHAEVVYFDEAKGTATKTGKQKKHYTRSRLRKIACAALAIAACAGTTVAAGTRLYNFHVENKAKHQIEVSVSAGEETTSADGKENTTEGVISGSTNLTDIPAVSMEIGYLPEGLVDNSDEKGERSYYWADDSGGFFIGDPVIMDVDEGSWRESFVQDYEEVTVGDKTALYVAKQYGGDPDGLWQDLYIQYPELKRIAIIHGWGRATKEDLIQIAGGIRLTATGGTETVSGQQTWSEYVRSQQEQEDSISVAAESDDAGKTTATDKEMTNLHQIGDSISEEAVTQNDDTVRISKKVTDVQISDDLSLLNNAGQIPDSWKELTLEDGTLGTATRRYYSTGDGINSLGKLIKEETVPLRLVYVTVEYTNDTDQDAQDVYYWSDLLRIGRENGTWTILTGNLQGADDMEYAATGVGTGEMRYIDVTGGNRNNNYIPELKAGETQTVHMAWLVGEDETDNLYLTLSPSGGAFVFTDEELAEGLIQLR